MGPMPAWGLGGEAPHGRALRVLFALAFAAISCSAPQAPSASTPTPSAAPSAVRSTPPTPAILTKLPVAARFGEQGIRVSPNGEMVLVVEREGFAHTVYDLAGRGLASVKLGEIGMNPFWLPDSSGVVTGQRIDRTQSGAYVLDVSILELDGTVRAIGRRVAYPRAEGQLVSPDGLSLAFDTPCCPSSVVIVPRSGGSARQVVTAQTQLRVISWDADGHVVYWAGGDAIDAIGADGNGYRVPLGLPTGVKAVDVSPGVRTGDGAATVIAIQADRAFPGAARNNIAERTLIARELRPYPTGAPLYTRVSAHEALTYVLGGSLGAYDLTTGVTRPVARIVDDTGTPPTAMSAGIVMSSPGRTWVRVFELERDDHWHETEVGRLLQASGYALSRGRFLVFDDEGAPYVLDGAAARAAPSRALPDATSPNAAVGTIREARGASVGSKMQLAWRMPDGAPGSLDYFAGSLVVIVPWTRDCIVCTEQLGLLSDVANGTRSRLEIFAIGVGESEASALDAAKGYRRLRPLIGSGTALKDLGPLVLPETFVLDSDHVLRERIVGPLTWDALVRALTAASKSRLALRDRDVALS